LLYDEPEDTGFSFQYAYLPPDDYISNVCPLSLINKDESLGRLFELYSAMRFSKSLPYPGAIYEQPELEMKAVLLIRSEIDRIDTQQAKEK